MCSVLHCSAARSCAAQLHNLLEVEPHAHSCSCMRQHAVHACARSTDTTILSTQSHQQSKCTKQCPNISTSSCILAHVELHNTARSDQRKCDITTSNPHSRWGCGVEPHHTHTPFRPPSNHHSRRCCGGWPHHTYTTSQASQQAVMWCRAPPHPLGDPLRNFDPVHTLTAGGAVV